MDIGVIELDSSSGSESGSDTTTSSSDEANVKQPDVHAYVDEGQLFYKHRKSAIMHRVKDGAQLTAKLSVDAQRDQSASREVFEMFSKGLQ